MPYCLLTSYTAVLNKIWSKPAEIDDEVKKNYAKSICHPKVLHICDWKMKIRFHHY